MLKSSAVAMYTSELGKDVRTTTGREFKKGLPVCVEVPIKSPLNALVSTPSGKPLFKIKSRLLYQVFPGEFIDPGTVDMEEALDRGLVPSLLGEDVEFDGFDAAGFPSLALALGLC